MKQIIVPTDFSSAADNAMNFAASLAQKINAQLSVLHIYQVPLTMNDTPLMVVTMDELKQIADDGLKRTKDELLKNHPGLNINCDSKIGEVDDEINEYAKDKDVFAIIMGTHNSTGLEKFLIGGTSLSVIRHSKVPVIVIPPAHKNTNINNIVLTTDLSNIEHLPYAQITRIVNSLQAKLHIVHIEQDEHTQEEKNAADALLDHLKELNPVYGTVIDKDVLNGLKNYTSQNNIDMVITIPHKHNFFERMFSKIHTEEFIEKISLPILCIHEEKE